MKAYKFKKILQSNGWIIDAYVVTDDFGKISSLSTEKPHNIEVEHVDGFAVPGFQNAHSHAFQYAMAGLAERHEDHLSKDDFWSWRENMYQLALTMGPDDLEHVAAMLYAEMVRHGYTHVAEFHYLHHDKDGKPYANLAEHGARLIAAAKRAGIKITLVPMFYQKGGFGTDPQERQRRFISKSKDDYFKLLESATEACSLYDSATVGFGIHSLRAVTPVDIQATIAEGPKELPFHIHIAEQKKEIEDALAYYNKRPVQWLLDNVNVDERFHLVHATHLDDAEVQGIAKSGAHVVLCPTTEGNLGDGIFRLKEYQQLGGKWSIGTDSHVSINPLEELRLLDYGQRLISHERSTFNAENEPDSGLFGFKKALISGSMAMGNSVQDFFKVGEALDCVVYRSDFPLFATASAQNLMSTIVYSGDATSTAGTIIDGKWVVKNQVHVNGSIITTDFLKTINQLKIR